MYEIKSRRLRSEILTCFLFFFTFIFKKKKKNDGFIEKSNLSEKNVIAVEELDGNDMDDIGNLEDSPRLKFIDEECGNLVVINDGGERTTNINQKKKSDVLQ